MSSASQQLEAARAQATAALLAARLPSGHWEGELSTSALSTATAVTALAVVQRASGSASRSLDPAIRAGLRWLSENANPDGGWGDTVLSLSNLSTTTLCWAAFGAAPEHASAFQPVVTRAEQWLCQRVGGTGPESLVAAILRRYGKDRTFSVPILTMCALAGRLGQGHAAWRWVKPLPFELAACPPRWFAALRLPVVSYALPALIAMGQARHFHCPTRHPVTRLLRHLTRHCTLRVLTNIQPSGGGFLEATPLTAFVTMSLAGSGQVNHLVTQRGLAFLTRSQRPDGSWPIDTNLATWLTTLAVNALGDEVRSEGFGREAAQRIVRWLLEQQHRVVHPYTQAAPGGWAWTDLSGGVPDADDTAGALLALKVLALGPEVTPAIHLGVRWLLGAQNRDGGIPTFCRGWGALPFDRSSPDLTAHALRAWTAWREQLPPALRQQVDQATARALSFLARAQRPDGAWSPLWFGNQQAPNEENPTYGTSRVLRALTEVALARSRQATPRSLSLDPILTMTRRGTQWLIAAQRDDGGWGGAARVPASTEETALAVEALAAWARSPLALSTESDRARQSIAHGLRWLVERIESGQWTQPAPIGFYFAKLWYFERLYPLVFTVGALNQAR